jgi:Tol biopolymer transport system component
VLAEILKSDPTGLAEEDSRLSPAIKTLLRRALNKNRDNRYQSVKELLQDLNSLDDTGHANADGIAHSQINDQVEGLSEASTSTGPLWYRSKSGSVDAITSGRRVLSGSKGSAARRTFLHRPKNHNAILKRGTLAGLVIACLICGGFVLTVYLLRQRSKHTTEPPQRLKITQFSNGGAWVPTISPDGKYVSYVANSANGELGIWIKEVATGYATQLVAPAGVNYFALFFSRDGSYLYYSKQNMNNMSEYFLADVYRIAIVGGPSSKILSSVGGFTFSPDGKQMAFIRVVPSRQTHDLIISNDDGADERVIATRHWPEISWGPTWSHDGRLIAFGARNRDGDSFYNTVMAVPVEGGPEQQLTSRRWLDVGCEVWLGDGSGLLMTGKEQLTDPMQIYFISYPSGVVSNVTHDTNTYSALQITADSRTLVAEVADVTANIRVASDWDGTRTRQITTGGKDGLGGLAWTPDGKIVYSSLSRDSYNSSEASGNRAIWLINNDGSSPRQLTADFGIDTNPVVTPDGRQLVFASHRDGAWGIWRAEMERGNSTLLASGGTTTFPVCSPDGQWVFFRRLGSSGPPSIWRVSTGGGEPMEMTKEHAYYPAVSPDGNWVAFFSPSATKIRLLVIPSMGGAPIKTFNVAPETDYLLFSEIVQWTADGRYLTYIKNQGDTSNIWGQPFAGGAPKQLTNFDAERIFSFAWSPDGKQLALARGQFNRQIVLLTDFR